MEKTEATISEAFITLIKAIHSKEKIEQFCKDVLCTAIEGGSNYWAKIQNVKRVKGEYVEASFSDYEDEEDTPVHVTTDSIVNACGKLAEAYPTRTITSHILTLDAGYIDVDDADMIIQFAVYGKIVFG
jgi:hypothetical protein